MVQYVFISDYFVKEMGQTNVYFSKQSIQVTRIVKQVLDE